MIRRRAPVPAAPLTSIIGREAELQVIAELIVTRRVRLLTLTGVGGVGKTRLAREVARRLRESFNAEIVWVNLAPVRDAGEMLLALSDAVGPNEPQESDRLEHLAAVLGARRVLIILDNFEHVIDAAPDIVALLERCANIVCLVTSREQLRVTGEHVLPIAPLPVSAASDQVDDGAMAASPAVELFIERAQAVMPSFAPTQAVVPRIAEICRRLDGLPLAIELAAARVSHLPPDLLLERLDRRLPLLTGGARDAPARLRTMRDAIAWSYQLLTPDEQVMFQLLGLFSGGFALDAVESIVERGEQAGGDAGVTVERSTVELVGSLVQKSLVRYDLDLAGDHRFGLLETIREFAVEHLECERDVSLWRRAHASFYLDFARASQISIIVPSDERQMSRLESERANLQAALTWFAESQDRRSMLTLVGSLYWYWYLRGYCAEGRRWIEAALALPGEVEPVLEGRARIGLAVLALFQGDAKIAREHASAAVRTLRETGAPADAAVALIVDAVARMHPGETETAEPLLNEALSIAATIPDRTQSRTASAVALANLGEAAYSRSDLPLARSRFETALEWHREVGDTWGQVDVHCSLGNVARLSGDLENALAHYRQSLTLAWPYGEMRIIATALTGIARIACAWQSVPAAARLLGRARLILGRGGFGDLPPMEQRVFDESVALSQRALGEDLFRQEFEAGERLDGVELNHLIEGIASHRVVTDRAATEPRLTPREMDVLRLLARGLSDRDIAGELFIGIRTVESHVASLFAKLGVRSRSAAVSVSIAQGLIHPGQT